LLKTSSKPSSPEREKRDGTRGNALRSNEFDPLAYIESAFLDTKKEIAPEPDDLNVAIPDIGEYIGTDGATYEADALEGGTAVLTKPATAEKGQRFKKTLMSAPRPRRAKQPLSDSVIDPDLQQCWETLPKSIEFLCSFYNDSVTKNYYRGEFKESRKDLIKRLLDPELSLEETSRLLGVCPATVRRYTNRGWLTHHRTTGGQRRFRLSDIAKFVEVHGRFPEE
jgi:excisionase family DNA binding protein